MWAAWLLAVVHAASGCDAHPQRLPALVRGATLVHLHDMDDADPRNDGARGYGTAASRDALRALKALDLNTVSLMAMGRLRDATDIQVRTEWSLPGRATGEALSTTVNEAHALGLSVVLVAHLQVDDGTWRGELAPADADAWMASYTAYVEELAALAQRLCVQGVSVGLELKSLTASRAWDGRFRALIQRVRARFHGEVTYSANWDELEQVRFWDALDVVGVNGFWPLQEASGAGPQQLRAGARKVLGTLKRMKAQAGKGVLLMEFGFKAQTDSALRPWEWPRAPRGQTGAEAADGPRFQAEAYEALLCTLSGDAAFRGAVAWFVPSDLRDPEHPGRWEGADGFSPVNKPAAGVLKRFCRPG